ncbi:MAG: alpha/beta hydrolase [Kofleriaceae bacterium]|nr:alpha/beta hydrolase [Kofleriaceae bacterium]MCL4223600.1 alpha/beta hydrolase [Myxococcales bacterium]
MTAPAGVVADPATPVTIPTPRGEIAGLHRPVAGARWLYVLGHGAGAGMSHRFMVAIADALADRGVATLRWEQPAMTAGRRRPDPPAVVEVLARAACAFARELAPASRLCAGGKSMGGRMTSQAQARAPLPGIEALIFLGFPLHPAGAPGTERARHLADVGLPLLFVSGTRDALATPALLGPVVAALPRARLVALDDADHGLDVPKRAGFDPVARAADAVVAFLDELPPR